MESFAYRVSGDLASQPEVLDAWRDIAVRRANPFLTPEWTMAWLETHPKESPYIIAWTCDGDTRGVLPLVSMRAGGIRRLRFVGARRGDWFTPACDPRDEHAMAMDVARLLVAAGRQWTLLEFDRVDEKSAWPEAIWGSGGRSGLAAGRLRRKDVLPYVALGSGGYDAYIASKSRNFRSQIGRRRRKLERERGLQFRMTTDERGLRSDMDTFRNLHEERWRSRGEPSSQTEDSWNAQYRFASAALRQGWLRLWIAEADGAPAAAWYGWSIGGRYCYSLSGLSQDFEDAGLGTVMLARTIEAAADEGVDVYDLMWGDEAYKDRFANGSREAATWRTGRKFSPIRLASVLADELRDHVDRLPPGFTERVRRVRQQVRR